MKNELSKEDVLSALRFIPPDKLNYSEWVMVGMSLKDGGFESDVWEEWSKADPRHHDGECHRKWKTFNTGGVSVGSIIHMAQQYGWSKWEISTDNTCLDWDDVIQNDGFDMEDTNWNGINDLVEYLETMFEPSDYVSYVTSTYQTDGGKFVPNKGVYYRTQKELLESLKMNKNDITDTIGSYEPNVGAWIRFNPVDGDGVSNDNVTRFKYALVESDTLPIAEQDAMYRKFQLPIEFLIHSGGKSLHAIVKVDAKDRDEYRQRVEYLYDFLKKEGMEIDTQNRNPSRLSRLPGVTRNGNRQYIVDRNIGRSGWVDWIDYVEGENDELPPFQTMTEFYSNPPKLPDELIEGVLRRGHKMLISGDSKAGKSWLMMELAVSISEGIPWLGLHIEQGKVLYINLEIDDASCVNRFINIYKDLGIVPQFSDNLVIWNLRGKAVGMDKLVPKIVRRTKDERYDMIIIDPIYKVQTGDENAAGDIANFCNQFDKLCSETGASAVYCHHHSKGSQGGKKMMDRASGSGVFARDPDAILDLIELEIDNNLRYEYGGSEYASAWQLEFSLREFANPRPLKFWFRFPTHQLQKGELDDCYPEGSDAAVAKKKSDSEDNLYNAFLATRRENGTSSVFDIASYLQIKETKVRTLIKKSPDLFMHEGLVKEKKQDG